MDLATRPRHLETEKLTTAITVLHTSCMCHYITEQPSTANNTTTVQTPDPIKLHHAPTACVIKSLNSPQQHDANTNPFKHCITHQLRVSLNHWTALNNNMMQTPDPFKHCTTHQLRVSLNHWTALNNNMMQTPTHSNTASRTNCVCH